MKKLMCLILALVTALSLVACGSSNGGAADNNNNTDDVKLKVLEGVVDWGETEPYRVLVQKGDPKGLLPGINKAIAELTADNNAKIHEIEEKVASTDTFTPDSVPTDGRGRSRDLHQRQAGAWSWVPAPTIPPTSSTPTAR